MYITIPSINTPIGSKNSYLTINIHELKKSVYNLTIDPICERVRKVWEASNPKAFFLIGKLSDSRYLNERLGTIVGKITAIPEKNLAALHGAVDYGLKQPLSIQRVVLIDDETQKLTTGIDKSYYDFSYRQYTHVIGIGNDTL